MSNNITSGGRITIPKAIRDHMGLTPGDKVEFEIIDDRVLMITKVRTDPPLPGRFEALRGIAGPGLSTDEIMTMVRGHIGNEP